MLVDDKKLEKLLLEGNYILEEDLKEAVSFISKSKDAPSLSSYLLQKNLLTKDLLGQVIAESINIPYSDLNSNPISEEQVKKIPEELAMVG